jgi:superfamily II DNA or RNA helicase
MTGRVTLLNECISVADGDLAVKLLDLLKVRPKGYQYTNAYRVGKWDGWVRFARPYRGDSVIFPTGFAFSTILAGIDIVDRRESRSFPEVDTGVLMFELRDYQKEALAATLENPRGIIKAPTGSGKTEMMIALIAKRRIPTLVVVHKRQLLTQTHDRIAERLDLDPDLDVGMVGEGKRNWAPITVGTVQTLVNRVKELKKQGFGMVIFDEVHHLSSNTWRKISHALPFTPYRYGFSATPGADKAQLWMLIGETADVIFEKTYEEISGIGYVAEPRVFLVDYSGMYRASGREWHKLRKAVENDIGRNTLIAELVSSAVKRRHKTLVLVNTINHGKNIIAMLQAMGIEARLFTGKNNPYERTEIVESFRDGDLMAIVATTVLEEGVDLPSAKVVVLAFGGKSLRQVMQRIGRGSRPKPGSNTFAVVDINDCNNSLLRKHLRQRLKIYAEEAVSEVYLGKEAFDLYLKDEEALNAQTSH